MESLFDSTLQSGCQYDPDEVHDVIWLYISKFWLLLLTYIIEMPLFTQVYKIDNGKDGPIQSLFM
jgi:hypothetical protein